MKILILRFSSIGDIVLTTPVIRCIKKQLKGVEVHYATKSAFTSIIDHNPYVDKTHVLSEDLSSLIDVLKKEKFDYIVDLHKNIRTLKIKNALKTESKSFQKLNVQKWLAVNTKLNTLPDIHLVDRYFGAVESLGVKNDRMGLDFFIPDDAVVNTKETFNNEQLVSVAVGAKFNTKQIPTDKLIQLIKPLHNTIILLGGKEDYEKAETVRNALKGHNIYNTCGLYSLQGSASIVKQSKVLLTPDTGMMHIAAAFDTPIVSVWGNTVPAFGMYPYRPNNLSSFEIHQVEKLKCRPCSKIGFSKCPKKHFKCMKNQNIEAIQKSILAHLNN